MKKVLAYLAVFLLVVSAFGFNSYVAIAEGDLVEESGSTVVGGDLSTDEGDSEEGSDEEDVVTSDDLSSSFSTESSRESGHESDDENRDNNRRGRNGDRDGRNGHGDRDDRDDRGGHDDDHGEDDEDSHDNDHDDEDEDSHDDDHDNSCEEGDNTGQLTIEIVVDGGDAEPSDFSFSVDGSAPMLFETSGSNTITLTSGIHNVVEDPLPLDYAVTYDDCSDIMVGSGYTPICTIINTYSPGHGNNAPVANAGVDQTITLPTSTVTLDGSASTDADGSIESYVWTFVSGPSTIDPTDAPKPVLTGLVQGTYVFKLVVTDDDGATAEDTVTITVNPLATLSVDVKGWAVTGNTPTDGPILMNTGDVGGLSWTSVGAVYCELYLDDVFTSTTGTSNSNFAVGPIAGPRIYHVNCTDGVKVVSDQIYFDLDNGDDLLPLGTCGIFMPPYLKSGEMLNSYNFYYSGPIDPGSATAGNFADHEWVQVNEGERGVWDMGTSTMRVYLIPSIDHGPLPGEARESTLFGSDSATGPWELGTEVSVHQNGPSDWVSDNYSALWSFSKAYRYVSATAGTVDFESDDTEIDAICAPVSTSGNNAPVANAGVDQTITLPTSTVTLDGSASTDADGTITSHIWTFVSGPSTIDPSDAPKPVLTGLAQGTYVFKLVVTDDDGATAEDTVTITVNPQSGGGGGNNAPVANAGVDQTITLPTSTVTLDGSASTDADGTITSHVWTFVSGPSTIDPTDAPKPVLTGLVQGTYVFKLVVTDDDGATAEDTVTITVNPQSGGGGGNNAPVANAGVDQTITLPTSTVTLDGSASTDADGTITSHVWTFVSGPSTIDPSDAPKPVLTGLAQGTYVFKLVVTDDDGATAEDTVTITVNPQSGGGGGNNAPVANAGVDQTITLPTSTVTLDGSASTDADGTITSHVWTFVSGPSTIDPTDAPKPVLTGLVQGTYVFKLVVTDDDGATADDTVSIEVDRKKSGGGGGSSRRNSSSGSKPQGQVLGTEAFCGIYVNKYLRVGYKNDFNTVVKVQNFLNNYMHSGLTVDGIYGKQTEAAVRGFQLARHDRVLAPWGIDYTTGIFYVTTQTEVNNIMCPPLNLPIPNNLVNITPADLN